jgi:stage II sporulation protein R
VNRLPRRTALVALMAAFVWTLTLRPALTAHGGSTAAASVPASRPLRLHILANSDRAADQAAKLAVRAAILPVLGRAVAGATDAVAAARAARAAAPRVAAAADRALRALGRPYGARVVVGDAYFPARSWGTTRLAAGVYPAVTVILGRGGGQNWWCVLFPDLCAADPWNALAGSEAPAAPERLLAGASARRGADGGGWGWWRSLWRWLSGGVGGPSRA